MDAWVLKLGIANGGLLVSFSMAVLSPPPTIWLPTSQHPPNSLQPIPLQQHSHSCLPPLTRTTAETPEQLELMTLVSRGIVCPLCLTPDQPLSLTHAHTFPSLKHVRALVHTHTCTHTPGHTHGRSGVPDPFWQYMSADHSRKATLVRGGKGHECLCQTSEFNQFFS